MRLNGTYPKHSNIQHILIFSPNDGTCKTYSILTAQKHNQSLSKTSLQYTFPITGRSSSAMRVRQDDVTPVLGPVRVVPVDGSMHPHSMVGPCTTARCPSPLSRCMMSGFLDPRNRPARTSSTRRSTPAFPLVPTLSLISSAADSFLSMLL